MESIARLDQYCISHMTAFDLLMSRQTLSPCGYGKKAALPSRLPSAYFARELVERYAGLPSHAHSVLAKPAPIELLVGKASARHALESVRAHVCGWELPPGSLIQLDDNGFVCCPELVFIQIAEALDFVGAVAAGCALCSDYVLDPSSAGGVAQRSSGPLTSTKKLAAYLRKVSGMAGTKQAKKALAYVHDSARSPRETALAMMLGLPVRYGGFALGRLSLNRRRSVYNGVDATGNRRYATRYPDIVFTAVGTDGVERTVGVEYNPWSTHAGRQKAQADAQRRNEFSAQSSLTLIEVTNGQANDYVAMRKVADQVRRALKLRQRPRLDVAKDSDEGRRVLDEVLTKQFSLWKRLFAEGEPQWRAKAETCRF